tara:strand:- start:2690 stop:2878 length:189 start_codon:yes stop_codon:yes gene_type:complete
MTEIRRSDESTWLAYAQEREEPLMINVKLLARYKKYLANAKKNNGNVQYWQTRIRNLLTKNP